MCGCPGKPMSDKELRMLKSQVFIVILYFACTVLNKLNELIVCESMRYFLKYIFRKQENFREIIKAVYP